MQYDGPIAVCIYSQDKTRTLHREGLPELTPCGLVFNPLFGASPGVIEDGIVPDYEPKCAVCFPSVPDEQC